MSVCFHPHLFDSERFLAEEGAQESADEKAMLLADCFTEEVDFGWFLDTREEVDALASELEGIRLGVRGLESDRVLLLRLLAVAREHGRGLAFMAL